MWDGCGQLLALVHPPPPACLLHLLQGLLGEARSQLSNGRSRSGAVGVAGEKGKRHTGRRKEGLVIKVFGWHSRHLGSSASPAPVPHQDWGSCL